MSGFFRYVLRELKNSFGLAILALVAPLFVLGASYGVFRKKNKGERRYPGERQSSVFC